MARTQLRKGYQWCPKGGPGKKGPCGCQQRRSSSIQKCFACNPQSGQKSPLGGTQAPGVAGDRKDSPVSDAVFVNGKLNVSHLKGKDRTYALQQEIIEGMRNITLDKKKYDAYLDFMAKNYRYSANNSLLIHLQKPHATNLKTYKQWQEMGYQVKKGSQSAMVLRPIFVEPDKKKNMSNISSKLPDKNSKKDMQLVGFSSYGVFDQSDLDFSVKEPPPSPSRVMWDESKDVDDPKKISAMKNDVENVARAMGAMVHYTDLGGQAEDGYTHREEVGDGKYTIVIDNTLPPNAQAYVLAHEVSHIALGHLNKNGDNAYTSGSWDKDRNDMECEAESLAYLLSRTYGLESHRPNGLSYLKGWSQNEPDRIKKAMSGVQKGAKTVFTILDDIGNGVDKDEVKSNAAKMVASNWVPKKKK